MGQRCCGFYCHCCPDCVRCYETTSVTNTRYARYQSDNEVDLDNIVGDLLELDPIQTDRDAGIHKINAWMDSISPQLSLPPSHIGISSAKCIKYWEAVVAKPTAKLSGSFVRFSFERRPNGELPRLLIEHKGRSVIVKSPSVHGERRKDGRVPVVQV